MKSSTFTSALLAAAAATLMLAPLSAQSAATADLYNHKCATCHGKDGAAHTLKAAKILKEDKVQVKDLRSAEVQQKLTDADIAKMIAEGKQPGMDGFAKDFTKAQIEDLVKYVRSLKK